MHTPIYQLIICVIATGCNDIAPMFASRASLEASVKTDQPSSYLGKPLLKITVLCFCYRYTSIKCKDVEDLRFGANDT